MTAGLLVSIGLTSLPLLGADPKAQLTRMAERFSDGRAHETRFVQTFSPAGFSRKTSERGILVVQAPNRLRFEYADPAGKLFTFDGSVARFYSPAGKQMLLHALSAEERSELPLVLLQTPDEISRVFSIEQSGAESGGTVLLKTKEPDSELAWIRLTFSPDGEPRSLSYQTSGGDVTEFEFNGFQARNSRPGSAFTITPPRGTRVIENGASADKGER
jgi:outer membrane lipoprotein carrier protein